MVAVMSLSQEWLTPAMCALNTHFTFSNLPSGDSGFEISSLLTQFEQLKI